MVGHRETENHLSVLSVKDHIWYGFVQKKGGPLNVTLARETIISVIVQNIRPVSRVRIRV